MKRVYRSPKSHTGWFLLGCALVCLVAIWLAATPTALFAQADTTPQSGGALDADPVSADEVNVVARDLWCPLCSGVRLDACELKACSQMKEMIGIKLAEGQDAATIQAYFVEQYGPQVLGEPPRQGLNWLAWILPFVALAGGGVFIWRRARGLVKREKDQGLAGTPGARPPAGDASEGDEYERKLEEELHQYG